MDSRDNILEHLENKHLESYPDSKLLLDILGKDGFKLLLKYAGGLRFSLPNLKSLTPLIRDYLRSEYKNIDSYNLKCIARDLGINEQTLRQIYNEIRAEKIQKAQPQLFGE